MVDAAAGRWMQVVTVALVQPTARPMAQPLASSRTASPKQPPAAGPPAAGAAPVAAVVVASAPAVVDTPTPAALADVTGRGGPGQADDAAAPASPPPAPPQAAPSITRARADHDHCPPVPFPPALRERGIEGEVHLLVRVSAQGLPAEVRVINASGWRLFDEAAVLRARNCRFLPERRGGDAVESWVDFPVRFALNG
jgi:periplasmic protein TonB